MTLPSAANAWTGRPSQEQLKQFSRGMMAQTFSIESGAASGALTSGTIYGALLPVYGGDVLSGLAFAVQTAGASTNSVTGFYLGITDLTGVLLALSADQSASANLTATGIKSVPFTTAYTVPANSTGCVYGCIIEVGSFATALQILARTAVTSLGQALGSNAAAAVTQTGQTTIPNPATLTANNVYPWLALV